MVDIDLDKDELEFIQKLIDEKLNRGCSIWLAKIYVDIYGKIYDKILEENKINE